MFAYPRQDLVAGTVVFLVAVPLCLGIAVASGVPPVSGLIAGIVGGLVVPFFSRAPLSVTGPAAGLTAIVLVEVERLGLGGFLVAVALAGALQIALGLLRAGRFSALVPTAVVRGMLAAIGITIVLKQIPVLFGVTTLAELAAPSLPALGIGLAALAVLYVWPYTPLQRVAWFPAALAAVLVAAGLGAMVEVPRVAIPTDGLLAALPRPDAAALLARDTWIAALTLALVASIETLLSVQAIDRLDPLRRKSPPDRELVAQGVGNVLSGLLGGLPMTAVIVRGGANVAAGGRERLSAIFHGLLLLFAVLAGAAVLNLIPLAGLAAVLIKVGLGLCRPALFREQWSLGVDQFVPFAATIGAILLEDLLVGVVIGVAVGLFFVLRRVSRRVVDVHHEDGRTTIRLVRDATFVSKPALLRALEGVPDAHHVVIDNHGGHLVDHDFKESIAAFHSDGARRGIRLELRGLDLAGVSAGGH